MSTYSILGGSWDLVTRAIPKVAIGILTSNSKLPRYPSPLILQIIISFWIVEADNYTLYINTPQSCPNCYLDPKKPSFFGSVIIII